MTDPAPDFLGRISQGLVTRVEDVATQALGDGAWIDYLLQKGRDAIKASVDDPVATVMLNAALDVMAQPENRALLGKTTQGAFTVFVNRIGSGARGLAREEYLRTYAGFEERHALLGADVDQSIKSVDDRNALVSLLESLATTVLVRGGAALAPFLISLL